MTLPRISIVGRPNVGKSTIFNRFVGFRRSIVHNTPGVTRDILIEKAALDETLNIEVVDTGGLDYSETKSSEISKYAYQHAYQVMKQSQLLLFVVDGQTGIHPLDLANLKELRKLDIPICLIINKMDPSARNRFVEDFYKLGLKECFEVAAEHNIGFEGLKDYLIDYFRPNTIEEGEVRDVSEDDKATHIKLAIVGRPNVGKSSLVNTLLEEERVIVSEIQGTTRDAIDIEVQKGDENWVLIDTAGLRKKAKVNEDIEFLSSVRTRQAIERAQVVILMIDAQENITTQESKIASEIIDAKKGLLILANKVDLWTSDESAIRKEFRDELLYRAPFLKFCAVHFCSAKNGWGVKKIWSRARDIKNRLSLDISEEKLKQVYQTILASNPPKGPKGFHLQFKRLSYQKRRVPTFLVRCNRPQWVPEELKSYFRNMLYQSFSLEGIPIEIIFHQNAVNSETTSKSDPSEGTAKSKNETA